MKNEEFCSLKLKTYYLLPFAPNPTTYYLLLTTKKRLLSTYYQKSMSIRYANFLGFLIAFCLWAAPTSAQKTEAKAAQAAGDYEQAVAYWREAASKNMSNDDKIQFAVCLFERANYKESAEIFASLSQKTQRNPLIMYYLARIAAMQMRYDDAEKYYRQYLQKAKAKDPNRAAAKLYLRQLAQAKIKQKEFEFVAFVSPIDGGINTPADEYGLMQHSRHETQYFYTATRTEQLLKAKRQFSFSQIMQINIDNMQPNSRRVLSPKYNQPEKNTALMGFLDEGYQILFARDGQIWIDNFDDDSLNLALPFRLAQTATWRGDFCFFGDNLLLFSAQSPDGYGKKDIYWSLWQPADSSWAEPSNIGAGINSEFDERSPFLCHDGQTLFFSRNSPQSVGGFDVFMSRFDPQNLSWSPAVRLPEPINSPADELFFYPQLDGMTAYMSSNRPQTKGGLDIFTVLFAEYLDAQATRSARKTFSDILLFPPTDTATIAATPDTSNNTKPTQKPIRYVLYPMFYETSVVEQASALRNVATLVELLTEQPNLQLIITAHAGALTQSQSYSLFLSLKQAESFSQLLMEKGIAGERILLRSYGTLQPVARPNLPDAQRLNQRLTLQLIGANVLPFEVKYQPINVSSLLKTDTPNLPAESAQGLSYKIQIRRSNSLWRHKILEERTDVTLEQWANTPTIIYLCGSYATFAQAQAALDTQIQSLEFEKIDIIPYFNGWQLDKNQAQALAAQLPELKNYLDWLEKK
jgi:tetratricopeptide (TPR) repeat protein